MPEIEQIPMGTRPSNPTEEGEPGRNGQVGRGDPEKVARKGALTGREGKGALIGAGVAKGEHAVTEKSGEAQDRRSPEREVGAVAQAKGCRLGRALSKVLGFRHSSTVK